jgi:carboxymethylenebutenolidase
VVAGHEFQQPVRVVQVLAGVVEVDDLGGLGEVPGGLGRKVAAAASFHGGTLAVAGDPSSPHLLAARVTATVYVAGAKDDDSFTADQAELLERALTDAGIDHILEFYPARHGFAVPDNPTYDTQADARHWEALHELDRAHLQGC